MGQARLDEALAEGPRLRLVRDASWRQLMSAGMSTAVIPLASQNGVRSVDDTGAAGSAACPWWNTLVAHTIRRTRPEGASMGPHGRPWMVGRQQEWARLIGLLDAAHAGGGLLVLRGDAGIGKTFLLDAVSAVAADDRGMTVVRMYGVPAEQESAAAGLFDLVLALAGDSWALPQRQADLLEALVAGEDLADGVDPIVLARCVLALVVAAAKRRPLLLAVDDVEWFDSLTSQVLLYAARRLQGAPVAALLAAGAPAKAREFDALPQLPLGPLNEPAARELLRRHSPGPMPEQTLRRVLALAAGNPAALVELPDQFTAQHTTLGRPIEDVVALGGRLLEVFGRDVRGLSEPAVGCLLVSAASFDQAVAPIQRACAHLGIDLAGLAEAEAAGVISLVDAQVRFRHPLIRSAVMSSAAPADRRAAHRALAESQPGSQALAARHLAAAAVGYDERVAQMLEDAAEQAGADGDLSAGVSLLELSADLTADPAQRVGRRVLAAEAAVRVEHSQRAAAQLDAAVQEAADPALRGRVQHLRARLAILGGLPFPQAVSMLETEAAALEELDPARSLAMRVDALVLGVTWGTRDPRAAADTLRDLRARAAGMPDPAVTARADLALAIALGSAGAPPAAAALLDAVAARPPSAASDVDRFEVSILHAVGRAFAEDTRGIRDVLERLIARSRRAGAIGALALPLALLAEAAFRDGDWATANDASTEALDLADHTGQPHAAMRAALVHALLAAGRGREDDVRQAVPTVIALAEALGAPAILPAVHWAVGLLELGAGRVEAAAAALRTAGEHVASGSVPVSPGVIRWRANLSDALAGMALRDEAQAHADALEQEARRSGSAYAAAAAARCQAVLAPADTLDDAFAVALTRHEQYPNPFERARLHLSWGRRLVEVGRRNAARPHLEKSHAAFEAVGAASWAAMSQAALEASGDTARMGRDTLATQLTDRQMQIARATVHGLPQDKIAEQLLLPPSTVRGEQGALMAAMDAAAPDDLRARLADAGIIERRRTPRPATATVQVLGGFAVRVDDAPVTGLSGLPARAVQAVAAFGGRIDAEQLAELLWPEQPEGVGRSRLRNILWRVQELTGPILQRADAQVRFADGVAVDAVAFADAADAALAAARQGEPDAATLAAAAAQRYGGTLLAGQRTQPWMNAPREALRRRFVALLDVLAEGAQQRGHRDAQVELLERAIDADPDGEHRYLAAARALLAQGRTAAARSVAARAQAVSHRLGAPHSQPLQALLDELDAQ